MNDYYRNTMTSRERVLTAMDHQEPDRLPVFRPFIIPTEEPFDKKTQQFLDTFDFDQFLYFTFWAGPSRNRELPDGTLEDGYGFIHRYTIGGNWHELHHPLEYAKSVDDVEHFAWPKAEDSELNMEQLRRYASDAREKAEYATAVYAGHLFQRYWMLRGFNQCFIDMKLSPELYLAIADRIYDIESTMVRKILAEIGEYTDFVMLNDDFGTTQAPFMSLQDFQTYIKPYFKKIVLMIKGEHPHIKIHLHSHGHIMALLPDLVDCGIDVLQPCLPFERMDPIEMKRDYGNRLSFDGGIDIERVLPFGALDEVREHVTGAIGFLSPGGGYLFRAQVISPLIPYENIITAYQIALEVGQYHK